MSLLRLPVLLHAFLLPQEAGVRFLSVDDAPDADGPMAVEWTRDGSAILVVHRDSGDVAFLDPDTLDVTDLVAVGERPLEVVTTPDGRFALCPCSGDDRLAVVDLATRALVALVPLTGVFPCRIEAASDSSFAVVGCVGDGVGSSTVSVVDLQTFQERSSFPTVRQGAFGQFGWERFVAARPRYPKLELADDDRTLLVCSPMPWLGVYDVVSGAELHRHSVDPLFVPVAAVTDPAATRAVVLFRDVLFQHYFDAYVVDLSSFGWTGLQMLKQDWGSTEESLVRSADGSTAFIAGHSLHFVDFATAAWTGTVYGGGGDALAVSADGAYAIGVDGLVTASGGNCVVVDLAQRALAGRLAIGAASDVAVHPNGGRAAILRAIWDEEFDLVGGIGGSLTRLATAPTGPPREADCPVVLSTDSAGDRAVTANHLSDNLALIDLRTESVDWIDVLDQPVDALLDPLGATAVVAHAREGLAVVDCDAKAIDAVLPITEPVQMSLSPNGRQAWLLLLGPGWQKRLVFVALAGSASHELGSIALGSGTGLQANPRTRRLATTPAGRILFVDAYDNELWIVDGYARAVQYLVPLAYEAVSVVASSAELAYVVGDDRLERFDVSGAPVSLGSVFLSKPELPRADEADGYLYVLTGGSSAPRLEVLDVAAMSVVARIPLPVRGNDLELSAPFVLVTLWDGKSMRFRAAGRDTELVSVHVLAEAPVELVPHPDGGVVYAVIADREDGLEIADFRSRQGYCAPANQNSTGQSAEIGVTGWNVAGELLRLEARRMPPHSFGMFLVSRTRQFVPYFSGSQGNLCLAPPIGRFAHDLLDTGESGSFELAVDTDSLPTAHGDVAVVPGETWCFQAWFRDSNPGPTSNTTDAVAVRFE